MDEEIKIRKMTKKEFFIRFFIWVALAAVAPLVYIGVKYNIFTFKEQVRSITGWGVIALIFTCIVLIYIINQARSALPKGNFIRQCIDGYTALLPILFAIIMIEMVKDSIGDFQKFLIFMIICEGVAVPINPMPKWGQQNHIDLAQTTLIGAMGAIFGRAVSSRNEATSKK